MIYLYNLLGLFLTFLWNASMLVGTIYLITKEDWTPWTLVVTLFFLIRWKEWTPKEPEPEEPSKIIL
jgi:hypothetical protein